MVWWAGGGARSAPARKRRIVHLLRQLGRHAAKLFRVQHPVLLGPWHPAVELGEHLPGPRPHALFSLAAAAATCEQLPKPAGEKPPQVSDAATKQS